MEEARLSEALLTSGYWKFQEILSRSQVTRIHEGDLHLQPSSLVPEQNTFLLQCILQ